MENIIANNGFQNAMAGMMIVFAGLILIAVVIVLFNFIMKPREKKEKVRTLVVPKDETKEVKTKIKEIPEDHLVAISAAIELYRRVHFDILQSEITFVHGVDAQNAWKIGTKFGQR